jgi:hypothetical protein
MRGAAFAVLLVAALGVLTAQQRNEPPLPTRLGGDNGPRPAAPSPNRAVPRLPDGTIDFNGVWSGGGPVGDIGTQGGLKPGYLESIMTPWAKGVFATRTEAQDPYNYCMPAGVPRMAADFAWRLVQYPTIKPTHIFLLYEGNMHSFRQIFMDGRKHPVDPTPTWFGHSIGHWEKDTLVVDTIGFNDKFWFDRRGTPHTEQLRTIERWARPEFTKLTRVVTIDDPGAFTRPFDVRFTAELGSPDSEILEYICIENNQYGLPGGHDYNPVGK